MASTENTAVNELIARSSAGQTRAPSPVPSQQPVPPLHARSARPEGTPTATPSPFGGLNERNPFLMTFPASMPVAAPFEQAYPLASRELIEAYASPPALPPPFAPAQPGTMVAPPQALQPPLPEVLLTGLPPSLQTFETERPIGYPEALAMYAAQPVAYANQPAAYAEPPLGYEEPSVVYPEPSVMYAEQPAAHADQPVAYADLPANYLSAYAGQQASHPESMVYAAQPVGYPGQPAAHAAQLMNYAESPVAYAGQPVVDADPAVADQAASSSVPPATRRANTPFKTLRLGRPSHLKLVIGKLVVPSIVLIIVGLGVGGYAAIAGQPAKPAAAQLAATKPTAASQPAAAMPTARAATTKPIAATVAPTAAIDPKTTAVAPTTATSTPAMATAAAATAASTAATASRTSPALVNVRIQSIPSGATVSLIDRGKTQLVGNTPIDVAVDPARSYDIELRDPDHPEQPGRLQHVDPRTTRQLSVSLDERTDAAPAHHAAPHHTVAKRERPHAEPAQAGEGQLMLSSKPPCEIFIDGNPTGLMTPQRSIPLAAGRHKITLVNREAEIEKTLTVHITANATEKRIADLMQ